MLSHAPKRSDPDPARDQDRTGRFFAQCETVSRRADRCFIAGTQLLVDEARPAPAKRLSLHAYDIAMLLACSVSQRIASDQAVPEMKIDMRTSRERGKLHVYGAQFEQA